jgi:hypothetical protein
LVVEFDFSEFARDGKTETIWTELVREWQRAAIPIADVCGALHLHLSKRLPLCCAVHSAGKSVHGWYPAFEHSENQLREFMEYAVQLGADHATWLRSQFVRLPDGFRAESSRRQVCYYLDPEKAVKL